MAQQRVRLVMRKRAIRRKLLCEYRNQPHHNERRERHRADGVPPKSPSNPPASVSRHT